MSQTPALYQLTIYKGETWTKVVTIQDVSATTGAATTRTLTSYTGNCIVKDIEGGTALGTFNTTAGWTLTVSAAAGTVTLVITAAASASLVAGTYWYDLELTVGSTTLKYLRGHFVVEPEFAA